jgi:hypothetical protein
LVRGRHGGVRPRHDTGEVAAGTPDAFGLLHASLKPG